jgi:hypothetical protein
MSEVRILSPTGLVGLGFPETSLRAGLEREPTFIGCDAGSTDPGPHVLGAGGPFKSRAATKRDLRLMILAGLENRIPVVVGSVGGSGNERALQWTRSVVEEIAREDGVHFRMAAIHAEQNKEFLQQLLRGGHMNPLLDGGPRATEAEIDECECIVGVMGVQPIQSALEDGAQVVLAGRSSDTSIFAALPLMLGCSESTAWHAAKLLEGGAGAARPATATDCALATVRDHEFLIEALNPALVCTPVSVAAMFAHETADLTRTEPTGVIDAGEAKYEALSDRVVRVTGSKFHRAEKLTIKLEAVQLAGYRAMSIGGVRDPRLLGQIDRFAEEIKAATLARASELFGFSVSDGRRDYSLRFRIYGLNGVMGPWEREKTVTGHEACVLIDTIAPSQDEANTLVQMATVAFAHKNFPGKLNMNAGNVAFPYSPQDIAVGPTYRFALNQVVDSVRQEDMFPVELVDL